MYFLITDELADVVERYEIDVPSESAIKEIVKARLVKLAGILGGSVSFCEDIPDSIRLTIPESWLSSFLPHLEVLLVNLMDVKSIEVQDDGVQLLRPNGNDLMEGTSFKAIVNNEGEGVSFEYVKKNGFCLLGYVTDDLKPTIYTLDRDNDLFRVYIFNQDNSSFIGLKEVKDIAVTSVQTDFFNCKEMVTLLEKVTNRDYYPKDKLNGYLTILEMFY